MFQNGTAVNPELIIDGKSQSEEPTTWTGLPQSDASTFMLGQVICGKCYEVWELVMWKLLPTWQTTSISQVVHEFLSQRFLKVLCDIKCKSTM